jgi:hypothetical protein
MPMLAKYHRADGLIQGTWSANNTTMLQAQIVPSDPTFGYLIVADQDAQVMQEQYVVAGGILTPKPAVTLEAVSNPFAADGTSVCTISVTPFVPCTVLMDTTPYQLVAEDPTIRLTSDAPRVFQVSLPHQAACWGAPLTVEAV